MIKTIILGRLTKDPTLYKSRAGKDYLAFTIAAQNVGDNEPKYIWATLHREGLIPVMQRMLQKGTQLYLEGILDGRINKFTNKDGDQIESINYSFMINEIQVLNGQIPKEGGYVSKSSMDTDFGVAPPSSEAVPWDE